MFKITMTSSTSRLLKDKNDLQFYQISEKGKIEFQVWQQEEDSIYRWEASFYSEGMFSDKFVRLELIFPMNYPFMGPSIKIIAPFKHRCINENGSFNFNDWTPAYNLGAIILMIRSVLSEDNPDFNRQQKRTEVYKSELMIKCHRHCDY